jgi:hypothetical protein
MKYIRLHKLGAAPGAPRLPGDPENYPYGQACDSHSLPAHYTVEGWLIHAPKVGEPVCVLRVSRNGVVRPGLLVTTAVTALGDARHFCTANSRYLWEELSPPGPPSASAGRPEEIPGS